MKCDKCRNYQPCSSGVDDGFYRACKEYFFTTAIIGRMTKEYKQEVMDGKRKSCKGFEKL